MNNERSNPLNDAEGLKKAMEQAAMIDPAEVLNERKQQLAEQLMEARIDPTADVPPPPIALSIGDSPYNRSTLATLGNFSLIIGKAKSKKTFLVTIAMAAASVNKSVLGKFQGHLKKEKDVVLFFDTEQGTYHVHRTVKRVCEMIGTVAPENFKAYGLRKYNPAERLALIAQAIENEPNLGFVVIDGARDLVTSINDEEQATELSHLFLKWTEERQIHLMTVLHQNKGDNNARGHLGSELVNKAETVLSVTKDKATEFSIVEAEFCRDREPEPFAFEIDEDGLPRLVEHWELTSEKYQTQKGVTPTDVPTETHIAILQEVFDKFKEPRYAEFWRQLKTSLATLGKKVGDNKAKDFAQYYVAEGYVLRVGNEGSPKATYQFNNEKKDQLKF